MMVKVYINWEEEEVLSEKEYDAKVAEKAKEIAEDMDELSEFLDDCYTTGSVYRFTPEERAEVDKRFAKHCKELAEEWGDETYAEHTIEL